MNLRQALAGARDRERSIELGRQAKDAEFSRVAELSRHSLAEVDKILGITKFNGRGGKFGYVIRRTRVR